MVASHRRAAHRPSRRHAIVDAATQLFAVQSPDVVTVADIADQAGMTPAAVYYHFPSKDDILLECMRLFSAEFVSEVRRLSQNLSEDSTPGDLLVSLLTWLEERHAGSSVFFVSSVGASLETETLRMEVRVHLITLFQRAVRRRGRIGTAKAAVVATSMVALLEAASVSWLEQDNTFRGLGRRDFLDEVISQANRVAGLESTTPSPDGDQ
ncbi:TetR/AcrR family transcriptional regulator [Nonomuraea sp. NPDC049480]|uniref:TetR/AcrR family transcriptional regulator n=1 Tax=Nonomuraea sp. NPDC049480 TaxID=3364353 RepID=UPI003798CCC6